jgi:hypothetical protein
MVILTPQKSDIQKKTLSLLHTISQERKRRQSLKFQSTRLFVVGMHLPFRF